MEKGSGKLTIGLLVVVFGVGAWWLNDAATHPEPSHVGGSEERARAERRAEVDGVRTRLASAPSARTVKELSTVLGPPTCWRGYKTFNPSVSFREASHVSVLLTGACIEGVHFSQVENEFKCERYPQVWSCDVRADLEGALRAP